MSGFEQLKNVKPFEKFLNFISKKQPFKNYLLIVTLLFFLYLGLNFLFQAIPLQSIDFGNGVTFNKTAELEKMAMDYSQNNVPDLANSFLKIFINNFIASLYILALPAAIFSFLVIIQKRFSEINASILNLNSILCKIFLLSFLMFNYIAITFSHLFFIFILPLSVFLTTYFHGIFEIPAMILSFTFSLLLIDDVHELVLKYQIHESKNYFKLLLKKIVLYITFLTILLVFAAFLETQITPKLIQKSFENYFLTL